MAASPVEVASRVRRVVVPSSLRVAVTAAFLVAVGRAYSLPPTSTETIRALPVTAALKAEIRTSFYRAYLADPREFSVSASLPRSTVIEESINDAAIVDGATPAENSAWVIGAVCMQTPVACQDAGAFQVFYRTALTGSYVYMLGGLCHLPAVLAAKWFPGGHYPLGIVCPGGGTLVRRGGIRPGGWTALVPDSWMHVPYGVVHLGQCSTPALPKLDPSLCSSEGGDTDIDVWFNRAETNQRLTVTTCRGGACFPASAYAPRLTIPRGATLLSRTNTWELAYYVAHGTPPLSPSSDGVTTLVLATRSSTSVTYPVYTVTVELPPSQAQLAAAIVDSFANP